ncbi:MAG: hypothetical protein V7K94_11925 [Nostoc sp.]|uniref:hypothetical protein n=1 Tax=Nostoc sp. TaxID=1180 RepID=UPI002FFC560F
MSKGFLDKNCDRLPKRLALSNGMRDAKNSTPQIGLLGDRQALIKIKQPQNCCWLVTIH